MKYPAVINNEYFEETEEAKCPKLKS